jgi:hypothetical protein
MKTLSLIIFGLLAAHSTFSFAEEITREQAAELMTQCQNERQEKIAPLKQAEIDKCINEQRRDKDQCERRNENFGQNRRVGGSISPGLFWDLPACQLAIDADKYFRLNPGRNTYNR